MILLNLGIVVITVEPDNSNSKGLLKIYEGHLKSKFPLPVAGEPVVRLTWNFRDL